MIVYLASPEYQLQAHACANMPVLLSFALWSPWKDKYQQSFSRILIDSGAFSEMNSGTEVDGEAYKDWWPRWEGHADAIAGLDDIRGNWKRSLKNYERFGGFPTMHDSDPPELLDDLVEISRKQGRNWLGIGLVPPGKERRRTYVGCAIAYPRTYTSTVSRSKRTRTSGAWVVWTRQGGGETRWHFASSCPS